MSQIQRGQAVIAPGTFVGSITGNNGVPVSGDGAGNIDLVGGSPIVVTGFPGINTLIIDTDGTVATQYTTNSGTAIPAADNLNVVGGTGILTSATGNTLTINLVTPVSIANGGTNASSFAVTNGTVFFNGTSLVTVASTGAAGTVLTSNGAAAPTFQASTGGVTSVTGTANQVTSAPTTGAVVLSIPSVFIAPGSIAATTTVTAAGDIQTTAGNLLMPDTNIAGTQGVLKIGGANYISNIGLNNNFIGNGARTAVTGQGNNFFGQSGSITTGNSNIAIANALGNLTSGSNNIALGSSAGNNFNGNRNILIGVNTGLSYISTEADNIVIGYASSGAVGTSNTLVVGNGTGTGSGQLSRAFISGIDGVNVGSVATVVTESGNQLGTAVLTAGTNVTIVPSGNVITINAAGGTSFVWSTITADQTAAVNNGYICNKASTLILTLPAVSPVGSIIEVTGINTALGWQLAQAAGQQIFFGTTQTTSGATGNLTSTAIRDSIRIVCVVANLTWNVLSSIGNITVV